MAGLAISSAALVAGAIARGAIQISEELTQLVAVLRESEPRNVMEIGAEEGGTFWLWCQVADGVKISLDKPDGETGSWKFADPAALHERTERFKKFSDNVHVITGDSHSPLMLARTRSILAGELLDFLFIDGDHTYDGVKKDFQQYRELVRRGGLIAFHDIKNTESHRYRGCFVGDFWAELEGNKREFIAASEWGGIGVIEN